MDDRKRIYIAGCGGMLGDAFHTEFGNDYVLKCSDIDLNESWLTYCDIRDLKQYEQDVTDFVPDYLFHLGALTDLEYCENHPDEAYMTNTIGLENAVIVANKLGIPILYISTAGIFNGLKNIYDDWDRPDPLGHYARSKYAGEQFVKENAFVYLVCRAGWMMGGGPKKDKKFVNKMIKQIKEGRTELFVVNDKFGTPTYTNDFARNVKLLIENKLWGLYNMACEGETNRLDVAHEIIALLDLNNRVIIKEVASDFFKKEYYAPRPPSEQLINRKLNLRGLNIMRNWKIALKEYIVDGMNLGANPKHQIP